LKVFSPFRYSYGPPSPPPILILLLPSYWAQDSVKQMNVTVRARVGGAPGWSIPFPLCTIVVILLGLKVACFTALPLLPARQSPYFHHWWTTDTNSDSETFAGLQSPFIIKTG